MRKLVQSNFRKMKKDIPVLHAKGLVTVGGGGGNGEGRGSS